MRQYLKQLKQNWIFARRCWLQTVVFGVIWAVFLAAHAFGDLAWHGWQNMRSIASLSLLVFIGAFIGGSLGWFFAILLGVHRVAPKRFAVAFVLILLATVAVLSGLFALQYRQYYSQWHMPTFTIGWAYQVLFTSAAALYLFAVQGLRVLLPFGPIGLVVASLYFARRVSHDNSHGD